MTRVPREKGQRAWGWYEVKDRSVVYQQFVFEDREEAVKFRPEYLVVCEVLYDGEKWVEFPEAN
ncbi:MAG: hypothetical protein RLZ71_831 [Actinomycetota bacterium]|jgi:hypothetical protein